MKIRVIAVGRLKEEYLREARTHFFRKISSRVSFDIVELEDEKTSERASVKENDKIKQREGEKILTCLQKNEEVVLLDVGAPPMNTKQFVEFLRRSEELNKDLAFVIGGSLGIGENVRKRASTSISFSNLTFPHQLFRIVLLEQISEALSKIKN
ncbi:MAG: 23S rRNA (pseudouridine(1915)-N(3))-methyltransferase RlmH [Filifactor alocis]|nr:23S rRNA (pseudouridine(1915)-N(3))-methyltransferase RlmH [Filifactor alocis]